MTPLAWLRGLWTRAAAAFREAVDIGGLWARRTGGDD